MVSFKFRVEERTVAPGQLSWVAIDQSSGVELELPGGGNKVADKDLVGQYPELQKYLEEVHGLDVPLVYDPRIDSMTRDSDGKTTWIFQRQNADVIVSDIPRTLIRVTGVR